MELIDQTPGCSIYIYNSSQVGMYIEESWVYSISSIGLRPLYEAAMIVYSNRMWCALAKYASVESYLTLPRPAWMHTSCDIHLIDSMYAIHICDP